MVGVVLFVYFEKRVLSGEGRLWGGGQIELKQFVEQGFSDKSNGLGCSLSFGIGNHYNSKVNFGE
jgi:hypothetical protein